MADLSYTLEINTRGAAEKLRSVTGAISGMGQAARSVTPPQLPATGRIQAATQALQKMRNALSGAGGGAAMLSGAVGGLTASLSGALLGALQSAVDGMKKVAQEGFMMNASLESAEIGIASVIRQFDNTGTINGFSDAMRVSRNVVEQLRAAAAESPATFQELLAAFQGTAGAAYAANIPINKQVDLLVRLSQASASLGVSSQQLKQELTALMTGNIDMNAALAKTLGITAEHITQQKEQGTLYDFLMEKTAAFAEAGQAAAKSYTVAVSNLKDTYQSMAAEVTKPLFDEVTKDILNLNEALKDPEVQGSISVLGDVLGVVYEQVKKVAEAAMSMFPSLDAAKMLAEMVFGGAVEAKKEGAAGKRFSAGYDALVGEIGQGVSPEKAESVRGQITKLFEKDTGLTPSLAENMRKTLLGALERSIRESTAPIDLPSPEPQVRDVKVSSIESQMSGSGKPTSSLASKEVLEVIKSIHEWLDGVGSQVANNVEKIARDNQPAGSFT